MGEREDDLGRRYNQEAGMAYNIHGLSHADYQRLLRIEAAARALLDDVDTAIADGVSTELKEALRIALRSDKEAG